MPTNSREPWPPSSPSPTRPQHKYQSWGHRTGGQTAAALATEEENEENSGNYGHIRMPSRIDSPILQQKNNNGNR
ncbi:hypothetical protein BGZ83_003272, partial [Gryganskiella cystojenkinii]